MKKKILIVFPHNFMERKSGVHTRLYNLCLYFKDRGFLIDQYALHNYESKWNDDEYLNSDLVTNFYFFNWLKFNKKPYSFLDKIKNKLNLKRHYLPELTCPAMIKQFNEIVKSNDYDFVLIAYAYWYRLILSPDLKKAKKIILIEDFLSEQEVQHGNYQNQKKMVDDEVRRINCFDVAVSVSSLEYDFFSKHSKNPKHFLVPVFYPLPKKETKKSKMIDITFIGFDNVHNIKGVNWFLKKVVPKISSNYKIRIVGKVIQKIQKVKSSNIKYVNYIKTLSDIYNNTKITICPMFSGTGLKIKIVESLMFGKPCVCTSMSLNGFPKKARNGCVMADNADDFATAISKLLSDKNEYRKQSLLAEETFNDCFGLNKNYAILDKIFMN